MPRLPDQEGRRLQRGTLQLQGDQEMYSSGVSGVPSVWFLWDRLKAIDYMSKFWDVAVRSFCLHVCVKVITVPEVGYEPNSEDNTRAENWAVRACEI